MAQSEPNPNNNPTVTGQEAWFNEDARFYKDVYVYGNLYYDFAGTDAFNLDQLNVCLLYTSPSPRDGLLSRMPSSA